MGKKHRQASTRPKLGRTAGSKGTAVTGAAAPKQRKKLASKKAAEAKTARTPKRSPEFERKRTLAPGAAEGRQLTAGRRASGGTGGKRGLAATDEKDDAALQEERQWREAERVGTELAAEIAAAEAAVLRRRNQEGVGAGMGADGEFGDGEAGDGEIAEDRTLPLVAICGRPNVGKSTLFNRLTGTRRSIVGDEPGITRDRIYGEVEWSGRDVRLVDTGGVVPDDEALIPSEIFRQAQVALDEADAIVMVVDGRTELASPDLELARLLLRGGKPCFLAVNKMDTRELLAGAENFRTLGFRNVLPISAEHGTGIGDLLDEVFAVLPAAPEVEPERMLTMEDEELEDEGPVDEPVRPRDRKSVV